jgi:thioredoxin-dependent peroxiredoxin
MPQDGEEAPQFALPTQSGKTLSLAAARPAVVYFYPKDDTSGCTSEAKDFSRLAAEFRKAGVAVLGISPDGVESHRKFHAKHGLAIELLSDADKSTLQAYGVWVKKSMYGRSYMGVERATFLIDKQGRIAQSWRKVKVPGHAAEVLEAAKALNATKASRR